MGSLVQDVAAKAEMLIRGPVGEVFNAFVDPRMITRFWLASASGPIEAGQRIRWEFTVPGAVADVDVKAVEKDKRILIEWSEGSTVEWQFTAEAERETLVAVTHAGFAGSADDIVKEALDSTQGFTIVLSELKALLEHGVALNLVKDKALTLARKCS